VPRTNKKAVAHSRICGVFLALEKDVSNWLSVSCGGFWGDFVLFGAKICVVWYGVVGVTCLKVCFVLAIFYCWCC